MEAMSSIYSRQELLELISLWKAAEKAVSTGQSYTIGQRTLTRVDLSDIHAELAHLKRELAALSGKHSFGFFTARFRRW